jgi:eukaryotic-like serine/threonine-protein kinase
MIGHTLLRKHREAREIHASIGEIGEQDEAHELTRLPAGGDSSDFLPSISPDSRALAFVRRTSTYNYGVMVLPLNRDGTAAGSATQVTTGVWVIGFGRQAGLDWTADGKSILYAGSTGSGSPTLWRVSREGGKPVRFEVPSVDSDDPTIARQSGRMIYLKRERETKIFKIPLGPRGASEPLPLVEAEGDQRDLGVAPDGSHIAFTSNRTGSKEIWIANSDGSSQIQRTFFNGPAMGSPRWSPDGKWIVFDGYASGSSDLYLIPAEGGKPVRLTSDPGNEIRPSWSHDGQWIYFGWTRGGGAPEIWKIRPSGGEPLQVTRHGGTDAFETPDGQWLYVCNPPKLSRMRPDASEETLLRNDIISNNYWVVGGHSVYVIAVRRPFDSLETPARALRRVSFRDGIPFQRRQRAHQRWHSSRRAA